MLWKSTLIFTTPSQDKPYRLCYHLGRIQQWSEWGYKITSLLVKILVQWDFIPVKHLLLVKFSVHQTKSVYPLLTPTVMQTHANRGSDSGSASIYRNCRSNLLFCIYVNTARGTIFAITSSKGVVQTVMQNENSSWFILLFLKKSCLTF